MSIQDAPPGVRAPLQRLLQAVEDQRKAEEASRKAVTEARERGATWQDIGNTLGITRQAAHERFTR